MPMKSVSLDKFAYSTILTEVSVLDNLDGVIRTQRYRFSIFARWQLMNYNVRAAN